MDRMTGALLKRPGDGRTVAVFGDVYRFLAMGDDTDGKYALWEAVVPPGGGPPPHVHSREEEGFYVLEGEITLQVGDRRLVAGRDLRQHAGGDAAFLQERDGSTGPNADLGRPCRPGADVPGGRPAAPRRGKDRTAGRRGKRSRSSLPSLPATASRSGCRSHEPGFDPEPYSPPSGLFRHRMACVGFRSRSVHASTSTGECLLHNLTHQSG